MSLKREYLFLGLKFGLDLVLIPLVFTIAYILKFKLGWILQSFLNVPYGTIYQHAQIEPYLKGSVYIIITWIVSFYSVGVYRKYTGITAEEDEIIDVIKGVTYATFFISLLIYFYQVLPHSKFVILYSWIIGIFLLSLSRLVINKWEYSSIRNGRMGKRVVVIGAESIGQDIVEKILIQPSLNYYYCGTLCNTIPKTLHFHIRKIFLQLGTIPNYATILTDVKPDIIFMTLPNVPHSSLKDLIEFCKNKHIIVNIISDHRDFNASMLKMVDFDGLPFVSHGGFEYSFSSTFLKRCFDLVVSFCILILVSPLFLFIALFIKIVSFKGPVFYLQERLGKDEKSFKMFKFRTMIPDAESKGPVMVNEAGDSRYIFLGAFLRKFSLDELPQFINVLLGQMSIVGPRPERPYFVEQFKEKYPVYGLRHHVKVGITGWAQINGRSVLTRRPDHKARYDLYYIKNWSFLLDLKIILRTLFVVLKGEEAY
jgi:exopolysaccharide biosynthesis polyprenyl glycosylphosphotransferase